MRPSAQVALAPLASAFTPGTVVEGIRIDAVIQVHDHAELYRVTTPLGISAAMKVARAAAMPLMERLMDRERRMLERLNGDVSPRLCGGGVLADGRSYLLTGWVEGTDCDAWAEQRSQGSRVRTLCSSILHAYARLHRRGLVHGDVHPRNILVSSDGVVTLVDFALAREENEPASILRTGVAIYLEPECARAMLDGSLPPAATASGEQYALAALLYWLLARRHYLDFQPETGCLLRQIAEDPPLPLPEEPLLEPVLLRALSKDPAARYATTYEFARAFTRAAAGPLEPLVEQVLGLVSDPACELPAPTASVTYGAAGVAYGLYRIASARADHRLFALADQWAERAAADRAPSAFSSAELHINPDSAGTVSPYHTAVGVAVVQAHLAIGRGDDEALQRAVARFLELSRRPAAGPDLLLGSAGVLLAAVLLLDAAGPAAPPTLARRARALAEGLTREIDASADIVYLGMAHGWAGILYALLRWHRWSNSTPDAALDVRLRQLAALGEPFRGGIRWPLRADAPAGTHLRGWCNGSAGYALLWTLAAAVYPSGDYLDLARGAALDAAAGGGGGHGLCCGFAGQAYAQLALFRATGEEEWLHRARELAVRAADFSEGLRHRQDDALPFSLFKGDLGVAVLAVELENPHYASMPFCGEEGWW